MNDKIKELSIKAAYDFDLGDPMFLRKYSVKFAQLIIQECVTTASMFSINRNSIHPGISYDQMSEAARSVCHTTCQHVAIAISEHFNPPEVN